LGRDRADFTDSDVIEKAICSSDEDAACGGGERLGPGMAAAESRLPVLIRCQFG
jgi:hypothetical protein